VFGLSITQAGLVVSVYGLGSTLGTALGGMAADRFGRRAALLASAVGTATVLVALSQADTIWFVVPGAFLLALLYDLHRPAVMAMVADIVQPVDRVRAYGLTYVTVNLGFAIAPALAGWLAGHSYPLVFLSAAAVQVCWALFVLFRLSETRPAPAAGLIEHGLGPVLKDRVFVLWLGALALTALVPHQGFVALAAWMKLEGYAPATFGSVIGLNGLLIVLVQPWVVDHIGRRDPVHMFILASLLQGAGFAMHGLGLGVPGHVAAVTVWTVGEIIAAPVTSAVVANLAPPALRGRYQGMVGMAFATASMVAPALGAAVLDTWGRALWVGCLVVGVVAAAGMAALGPSLRRRLAAQEA
jgi:MFS family permease